MTSTNGIYLGNNGLVELQRISAEDPENIDIRATLLKSDVDTTTNSISFDPFNTDQGGLPFTTGDRLDIGAGSGDKKGGIVGKITLHSVNPIPDSLPTQEKDEIEPDVSASFGRGLKLGPIKVDNGKLQTKVSGTWTDVTNSTELPIINGGESFVQSDLVYLNLGPKAKDRVELIVTEISGAKTYELYFFDNDPGKVTYYVHVSRAGNISFYDTFEKSLGGKSADRIKLQAPKDTDPDQLRMYFNFSNSFRRFMAQVTEFTINTNREFINTTTLGKEHMNMHKAGLISGNGTLRCQWNYQKEMCSGAVAECDDVEFAQYLATILLRSEVGAAFAARFFMYATDEKDVSSVWYECPMCLVQKVGVSVEPTEIIYMDIDFVMNGAFSLQMGKPPNYLLTEEGTSREAGGFMLQEDQSGDFELELYEDEDV